MTVSVNSLSGSTGVLGIIGNPVKHSMSPVMQNAVIRACGLDLVYVPFEVAAGSLGDAVAGLKALGVVGFNVTIPYKSGIMVHLDGLDETAVDAGAVNTVKNESGRLIGYNTDGDGLLRSLAYDLDFTPECQTVLMIGAGGAARGAMAALCRAGVGRVFVFNRTAGRGDELVSFMKSRHSGAGLAAFADESELERILLEADLVINATSLGMKDERIPGLRMDALKAGAKVYDMVYAPPVTALLNAAAGAGLRCANGLGMLAAQGELAFSIWTGIAPPSGLMRQALAGICSG